MSAIQEEIKSETLMTLESAHEKLKLFEESANHSVESLTGSFKSLAAQADLVLKHAATIVGHVESESMRNAPASVASLCEMVKDLLAKKLKAAESMLATLGQEEMLLGQLNRVTSRQEVIAARLKTMSVLTNVEAAHLSDAGGAFHLLAQELSAFSRSVSSQTLQLASHTDAHKATIRKVRLELSNDLPKLQGEVARTEQDIAVVLRTIESSLQSLGSLPAQFKNGMEETTRQIAGVTSAIMSHDITRQQNEHVLQSLNLLKEIPGSEEAMSNPTAASAAMHAGLAIQIEQLKLIRETVAAWISQAGSCMDMIGRLSASELVSVGSLVLQQERQLSEQLAQIQHLQQKSQTYGGKIQQAEEGLSSLLALVNEHLTRAQEIRERLQLLMFNSLIEANRLKERGVVVASIANLIKVVSVEWDLVTDTSRSALTEMTALLEKTKEEMVVFSESTAEMLRDGQAKTRATLDDVRRAAVMVSKETEQMESVTGQMQISISEIHGSPEDCLAYLDGSLGLIEDMAKDLKITDPKIAERYDEAGVEELFSGLYTTEIERNIMHAVLRGTEIPKLQESFAGNDVELF